MEHLHFEKLKSIKMRQEKNFSAPKNFRDFAAAVCLDLFLFLVKNIYLVVQHVLVL